MSHIRKLMMTILTRRLHGQVEHLADEQAGFRKDRSMIQQILALALIAEKVERKGQTINNCFVDLFDSISHKATWAILVLRSGDTGN